MKTVPWGRCLWLGIFHQDDISMFGGTILSRAALFKQLVQDIKHPIPTKHQPYPSHCDNLKQPSHFQTLLGECWPISAEIHKLHIY